MKKLKSADAASLMMLAWLVISFFFPTRWVAFSGIVACGAPMVLFKHSVRGVTFGARDCNTAKYKISEYALFFAFCICGAALVSAITYLTTVAFGTDVPQSGGRTDFFYLLVFSCFIPAFFEEWFMRGGVLGTLAKHRGAGVLICAVLFALMHMSIAKIPYAFFSGLFITALVYLTECVYLGMLLHFLNNLTSLVLSYLPSGVGEYIMLGVIAVAFLVSAAFFKKTSLCRDTVSLFSSVKKEEIKELCTPCFWVFAASVAVIVLCASVFTLLLPAQ